MGNKINVAEILKYCPKGMELDCTMYEDVYFDGIDEVCDIIKCYIQEPKHKIGISFNKYGHYSNTNKSKCVIFPKGKTTWEGFVPPYKFKDGDVVVAEDSESFQLFLLKHLTHSEDDNDHNGYCYFGWDFQFNSLFEKVNWGFNRLATEEEKQKLFDAIKANGYKWNAETKTLEKLVEPKFKVGDKIVHKVNKTSPFIITEITNTSYKGGNRYEVLIEQQDNFELLPNKFDITTLKPFDKVLVRSSSAREWTATLYSHYNNNKFYGCGMYCDQCIPYEHNEHLCGTDDDCNEYYKTWE